MRRISLDAIARGHLREIHTYSVERWGEARADAYIRQLSARFDDITAAKAHSRDVSALFGVTGRFCRCAEHLIYWRTLGTDAIAVVAILHQRMHQPDRVRAAFDESP